MTICNQLSTVINCDQLLLPQVHLMASILYNIYFVFTVTCACWPIFYEISQFNKDVRNCHQSNKADLTWRNRKSENVAGCPFYHMCVSCARNRLRVSQPRPPSAVTQSVKPFFLSFFLSFFPSLPLRRHFPLKSVVMLHRRARANRALVCAFPEWCPVIQSK